MSKTVRTSISGCALFATLFFASYYGTTWWTVSGLETAVYVFLSIACISVFVHSERAQQSKSLWLLAACSLLVFLASITRPEGPVLGIVIGSYLLGSGILCRTQKISLLEKVAFFTIPFIALYGFYFHILYYHFGPCGRIPFTVRPASTNRRGSLSTCSRRGSSGGWT